MIKQTSEDIALEICNNRTTYEHGAQKIDSYASHLVQKARDDERRRWAETEKHGMIFIDATPDNGYVLRILQAYIDDSYYSDNTAGLPPENPLVKMMNETREKRNGLLRSAIAILQGAEPAKWDGELSPCEQSYNNGYADGLHDRGADPAKVSEDVERGEPDGQC